jgi:uncharacterized protein
MILEGLVTTRDEDGSLRIAPMGPNVNDDFARLLLRPYQTSRTFGNLRRTRQGVLHVTDDVESVARAAVGAPAPRPPVEPAPLIDGYILTDACRWYAFRVESINAGMPRAELGCQVVAHGRLRDFFGFNRAKHAVLEVAVLATRAAFVPRAVIHAELDRAERLVDKTGGPAERRALDILRRFLDDWSPAARSDSMTESDPSD